MRPLTRIWKGCLDNFCLSLLTILFYNVCIHKSLHRCCKRKRKKKKAVCYLLWTFYSSELSWASSIRILIKGTDHMQLIIWLSIIISSLKNGLHWEPLICLLQKTGEGSKTISSIIAIYRHGNHESYSVCSNYSKSLKHIFHLLYSSKLTCGHNYAIVARFRNWNFRPDAWRKNISTMINMW